MRIKWNSYRAFEEVQTTTTTLEVFLALSTSLNMHTPYGSAVVHTCVPKTYKGMPVAVKIWKEQISTKDREGSVWSVHATGYGAGMEMNHVDEPHRHPAESQNPASGTTPLREFKREQH